VLEKTYASMSLIEFPAGTLPFIYISRKGTKRNAQHTHISHDIIESKEKMHNKATKATTPKADPPARNLNGSRQDHPL
jgi:hypothetical protein